MSLGEAEMPGLSIPRLKNVISVPGNYLSGAGLCSIHNQGHRDCSTLFQPGAPDQRIVHQPGLRHTSAKLRGVEVKFCLHSENAFTT